MFFGREDLIGRLEALFGKRTAPIVEADGYFDALIPFRRLLGI